MGQDVDRETHLARTFAEVARQLQSQNSPEETWQRIVELAGSVLPAFEHAAISLARGKGRIVTVAATDQVPRTIDQIQYDTGEGPCLSAIREHEMFITSDLSAESRWPAFGARAVAETGVRSMLAFQLFVRDETLGALNLYSREPNAFDERAEAFGAVLAAHAAVAMAAAQEHQHTDQLEHAVLTNRDIGMALGIVMTQSKVDRVQAFRMLEQGSQRLNLKLKDIAARIVSTEEDSHRRTGSVA
jgi:GAF domain-containing protein